MTQFSADAVAKAFNAQAPNQWKARAYMKTRAATGTFNAVNFSYKSGMLSLLMDCDKPLGQGFQIKFHSYTGAFGDYLVAIGKALYQVLTALREAEIATTIPEIMSHSDITFGLRRDGSLNYLSITGDLATTLITGAGASNELTYVPDFDTDTLDTTVDDLL